MGRKRSERNFGCFWLRLILGIRREMDLRPLPNRFGIVMPVKFAYDGHNYSKEEL